MFNRLGILAMHDNDGIVDDYILYLLNDLKQVVNHFVIVCNGAMKKEAIDKLKEYTDDVFVRPDTGYDAAAFKDALENLLGWKQVYKYDELVLVNDSFYGPFDSFVNVFKEMAKKEADFWGLTAQPTTGCSCDVYGMELLPYHIQPYFLVVRNKLLKSREFTQFWKTMKKTDTYIDAVINYELRMTEYFVSYGYKVTTYVDITSLISNNPKDNLLFNFDYAYQLLSQNKMPVIKRRIFTFPPDSNEDIQKIIKYIELKTNYDIGMIWRNLIRIYDPVVLNQGLHLEYVLPHKVEKYYHNVKNGDVAVIAHLYYQDLFNESFSYLKNIPKNYDIYITVQSDEVASTIRQKYLSNGLENAKVRVVEKRGRDVSALLVGCNNILMKYKYLCFVHDKKTSGNVGPAKLGMSYMYMLWENMLKSECYIKNIIGLLEKEDYLGVVVPPSPYHGVYINIYGNEWTCCYKDTKELAEKLKLNCVMSDNNSPFTLSTALWCKTKALKSLFEYGFTYEDFPEEPLPLDGSISHSIERIFAYVAQHEGYTTGIVMNDEYAGLQLSNYSYMMNKLLAEDFPLVYYKDFYGLTHPEQFFD